MATTKPTQSARSQSMFPTRSSSISAGASPPRAGPTARRSPIESQGVQLATAAGAGALLGRRSYDWRKVEARLNALPQFITDDRRGRHPLHPRPLEASRMRLPLIITHGWPGSVIEQLKVIESAHQSHGPWRDAPRTRSTSSSHRCRATASPASRRAPAGIPIASRAPGRADEAPRIHHATSPRAATGARPFPSAMARQAAAGIARHPHQPAGDRTARGRRGARRRRARAGGTVREGARGVRLARHVLQEVPGLRRR